VVGQLFYNTMIPACLWFISRDRSNHKFRNRKGEVLFIDARNLGEMIDRRHRELTNEDISRIASTYHAWRGEGGDYKDIAGFCKSTYLEEIRKHSHILTPGRYVGTEEEEADSEPFGEKMERLTKKLSEQFAKSKDLEDEIRKNLSGLGYEF